MSLTTQFETMLAMIAMGLLFGALLDTYQRFLKRPKRARLISFFTDIIFWCLFGLLVFYSLYQVNFGEVHLYIFLALLCGFSAYQALFKHMYLKILERLIFLAVRTFLFLKRCFHLLIITPPTILLKTVQALLIFLKRSLLFLAKMILSLLLLIGKIIFSPVLLIWRIFPASLRKKAENFQKEVAGFFLYIKNKVNNAADRWKK